MAARTRTRALGVAVALASMTAAGCSWTPRHRPVRDGERLVLPSAVVPAPGGAGWRVSRSQGDNGRVLELVRGPGGAENGWLTIVELETVEPLPSRETLVADLSTAARGSLRDPAARVDEIPTAPERLGLGAVVVALRAEQSTAKAGVLERHVVSSGALHVVSPGDAGRTLTIQLSEAATSERPGRFAEDWAALLSGIEITPADRAHVAAAARADDFPKEFQPGLARRSLTLPRLGFQWGLERHRWVEPGGFTRSAGLAFGLTDRLELDTPGFLRLSFGEVEALTRPEYAIGAGLTGVEHDGERGTTWTFGLSGEARKRVAKDVAVRALVAGDIAHESRTGRTRPGGGASAGVVWDVDRRGIVSLGLEAGWRRPADGTLQSGPWIGGLHTPLVTLHAPFVDLGFLAAVAWDDGTPGVIAGASFLLTL